MSSPFDNIISAEFKNTFNQAIDAILANNALTVPCTIRYAGAKNTTYCNNCKFDNISKLSSNIYNGTGPVPFVENTICPVCMGIGLKTNDSSEIIYLAVIFDGKYFLNTTSSAVVNIVDGMIQTLCNISHLPKIRNADEIIIDNNISNYGGYTYQRAGDPIPMGLGDNRYILTTWKRK